MLHSARRTLECKRCILHAARSPRRGLHAVLEQHVALPTRGRRRRKEHLEAHTLARQRRRQPCLASLLLIGVAEQPPIDRRDVLPDARAGECARTAGAHLQNLPAEADKSKRDPKRARAWIRVDPCMDACGSVRACVRMGPSAGWRVAMGGRWRLRAEFRCEGDGTARAADPVDPITHPRTHARTVPLVAR